MSSPLPGVEPAAEDPRGRVVGGGHRAVAVDDDHALLEGGHGGGVAPLDGGAGRGRLLGQLALRDVAQDDLEGGLAAPARAGAGHLDGRTRSPSARTIVASKPFTTSPGSLQLGQAGDGAREVVGADERRDGLARGASVERLQPDHAQAGGVGVDDEPVLVDDDAVGGVLDEELEPLADVGGDPGHVAGLRDVGHDAEEPGGTGVGDGHGPDEHAVDVAVGRLELLDQLVVLPRHPGPDRLDDGRQHGVAELARRSRAAAVVARGHDGRCRRGSWPVSRRSKGACQMTPGAGDLELPHHHVGEVRDRGELSATRRAGSSRRLPSGRAGRGYAAARDVRRPCPGYRRLAEAILTLAHGGATGGVPDPRTDRCRRPSPPLPVGTNEHARLSVIQAGLPDVGARKDRLRHSCRQAATRASLTRKTTSPLYEHVVSAPTVWPLPRTSRRSSGRCPWQPGRTEERMQRSSRTPSRCAASGPSPATAGATSSSVEGLLSGESAVRPTPGFAPYFEDDVAWVARIEDEGNPSDGPSTLLPGRPARGARGGPQRLSTGAGARAAWSGVIHGSVLGDVDAWRGLPPPQGLRHLQAPDGCSSCPRRCSRRSTRSSTSTARPWR